jgi:ABC-2 type transport system ATP-binding protein
MTTSGSGNWIIETQALRKTYGSSVIALDSLDLQLPNAAVGLLGANGAGKSTLIKALLGLLQPTSGSAWVLGRNVAENALSIRERVGYMPESDTLPMDVTAADFVGHMAEMSGLPPRAARQRANDVLYHVGLNEARYRLIRGFSTGMKQRVKLAQAIVHDPALVFLDEPTNGMDPQGRDDMLSLIARIHNNLGITVLLSSHILGDVERVCDYVIMLDSGRLVVADTIEHLRQGATDIQVRIDGDIEEFTTRLKARRVTARVSGSEILVERESDEVFDAIRDVAADLGVALRMLRPRERSLEDVYIQTVSAGGADIRGEEVQVGN